MIQNIRHKFNEELLTLFTLMRCFIDALLSTFGVMLG